MRPTPCTLVVLTLAAAGSAHAQGAPPRVEVEIRGVSGPVAQPEARTVMRDAPDALGRCLLRVRGVAVPLGAWRYAVRIDPLGAAHADEAPPVTPAASPTEATLRACFRAALARYRYAAHPAGPTELDVTVRLTAQD